MSVLQPSSKSFVQNRGCFYERKKMGSTMPRPADGMKVKKGADTEFYMEEKLCILSFYILETNQYFRGAHVLLRGAELALAS